MLLNFLALALSVAGMYQYFAFYSFLLGGTLGTTVPFSVGIYLGAISAAFYIASVFIAWRYKEAPAASARRSSVVLVGRTEPLTSALTVSPFHGWMMETTASGAVVYHGPDGKVQLESPSTTMTVSATVCEIALHRWAALKGDWTSAILPSGVVVFTLADGSHTLVDPRGDVEAYIKENEKDIEVHVKNLINAKTLKTSLRQWRAIKDDTDNATYYVNVVTSEATWTKPDESVMMID